MFFIHNVSSFSSVVILSYLITNELLLMDIILNDVLHRTLIFVIQNYSES